MMRRWLLAGVAMLFFLGGCATDERTILIKFARGLLDETATKVRTIQEKVVEATDRMIAEKPADRELDLSEANEKCKLLKDFSKKEVQGLSLKIQSARLAVSDAEKEEFRKTYGNDINKKMDELKTATDELNAAVKKMESAVKTLPFENISKQNAANKAVEDFKKQLGEAQAEFESLNRKG